MQRKGNKAAIAIYIVIGHFFLIHSGKVYTAKQISLTTLTEPSDEIVIISAVICHVLL
jgi:hypothetical protein